MLNSVNLETIAREIRVCTLCPLCKQRKLAVPGEGHKDSQIMLIGEAPGSEEDTQGRPFVGRAGQRLDMILQRAAIDRSSLFITNVVKCRPPHNRVPHKQEIEICVAAHLQRQLRIIQPKVVCLQGTTALKTLLNISRIADVRGKVIKRDWIFLPTYHPAAVVRNPSLEKAVVKDFRKLIGQLEK